MWQTWLLPYDPPVKDCVTLSKHLCKFQPYFWVINSLYDLEQVKWHVESDMKDWQCWLWLLMLLVAVDIRRLAIKWTSRGVVVREYSIRELRIHMAILWIQKPITYMYMLLSILNTDERSGRTSGSWKKTLPNLGHGKTTTILTWDVSIAMWRPLVYDWVRMWKGLWQRSFLKSLRNNFGY